MITSIHLLLNVGLIYTILCMGNNVVTAQDTESIKFIIGIIFAKYVATSAGFYVAVIGISKFIMDRLTINKSYVKQLITMAVSVVLSLVGWFFRDTLPGIFTELSLLGSIIFAVKISLESNGLFDLAKNINKEIKTGAIEK